MSSITGYVPDYKTSRRGKNAARRNRWSKREYQQHILQLARGKPGREDDAGEVVSKNWWNANQDSMSHMYEQEEIDVNGAKDANGSAYQQFWGGDGIVTKGVDNTVNNVGRLAREGMRETDKTILKIMLDE